MCVRVLEKEGVWYVPRARKGGEWRLGWGGTAEVGRGKAGNMSRVLINIKPLGHGEGFVLAHRMPPTPHSDVTLLQSIGTLKQLSMSEIGPNSKGQNQSRLVEDSGMRATRVLGGHFGLDLLCKWEHHLREEKDMCGVCTASRVIGPGGRAPSKKPPVTRTSVDD